MHHNVATKIDEIGTVNFIKLPNLDLILKIQEIDCSKMVAKSGGPVVSVLAFNSDGVGSNPAEVCFVKVIQKYENGLKRGWPIFKIRFQFHG